MESITEALALWFWVSVRKLAERYPILVGVPLMLLPLFMMAGIIYLIASWN